MKLAPPEPAPSEQNDIAQNLRDVVALAMLPGVWTGADPLRIAESLAAALYTTLEPEFVYVAFTGSMSHAVAQTDRYHTSAELAERIGPVILEWSRTHDVEELLSLPHPSGRGSVRVATRALGMQGELGVIAAGFSDGQPAPSGYLILNVAASQATTAIQNVQLMQSLRASEQRVREVNAQLSARVAELQATQSELRNARASALNVMEDALKAREQVETLNAELRAKIAERERSERALRESEARFRTIFESVGVSVWEEDFTAVKRALDTLKRDGVRDFRAYFEEHPEFVRRAVKLVRVLDVNERTLAMFGAPDKAHMLRSLENVFLPETQAAFIEELVALAQGRSHFEAEVPHATLDGRRIDVLLTVSFPAESENYGRVLVSLMDVTERKRAQTALDAQRRLYEGILDNTPDLAYIFDLEHRFIYANQGLLRMWGKTWDEAIGRTCLELGYEPGHAARHDREIERVIATRRAIRGEMPFTGTLGRRIYDYIFTPILDGDGNVVAVAGTTRDVTAYRQAQDELRARTDQTETLLNQAPLGVYLVDADFRIAQVNPVALPVFGDIPGGVIGRDFDEVIHILWVKSFADEVVRIFRHTLETGEPHYEPERAEFRIDRGITEYYEWRLDRITLPDARFGLVCYFRDISSQVLARKEIEVSREALKEADRRKDEFLAQLAHELRNPLAPVRNAVELLRRKGANEPEVRWSHDVIDRQVSHLTRLIDDLLDVSRITRNKLELRRQRLDLTEVIQAAVESSRPVIEQCGHQFSVALPPQPVWLHGDLVRLAQVFMNLLVNAAKYTEHGGHIWLSAARVDDRHVPEVVIRVRDTGVGIPQDKLPQLFQMFFQVDQALTRSQGGLGIGLSLVRSLVELHGGSVIAHSDGPGKGSEFVVRLPVIAEQQKSEQPEQPTVHEQSHGGSRRRIVIVDDNRDAADSLALLLQLAGDDAHSAHDGHHALELMERLKPEIALLDIGMPHLDGYDLCRRIRKRSWGRTMALIALTGWGQEEDRRRTREAGFDAHMVKPVDHAALLKLLASLSEARPAGQTAP